MSITDKLLKNFDFICDVFEKRKLTISVYISTENFGPEMKSLTLPYMMVSRTVLLTYQKVFFSDLGDYMSSGR